MCPEAPNTTPDVTSENMRNTTLGRDKTTVRSAFKLLSIDFNFRGGFCVLAVVMINGLTPVIDPTALLREVDRFISGFSSSK